MKKNELGSSTSQPTAGKSTHWPARPSLLPTGASFPLLIRHHSQPVGRSVRVL